MSKVPQTNQNKKTLGDIKNGERNRSDLDA